ncbi:MAG: hypothetical protein AAGJ32_12875 [Pseudomonadota bacterium]
MISCNCIVQAGQISAATEATLRANLEAFSQNAFGEAAHITWREIPEGSGFTAAQPSTSSIVSMTANAPLQQSERATLLKDMCTLWIRETNQTLDEVVGVISDPQTA